jgi:sugar transferase (PEP-CTERM/EpsH1 system associated)
MANLLYLVHRLPYPPNKGDKVRSYHLLRHLARNHRVFLGSFIDDPADKAYLETVRGYCAGMHVATLSPRMAKLRSLSGLLNGEALSLPYYRNAGLREWVSRVCDVENIDAAVVFSSVMADYLPVGVPALVDFVDMDSAKWRQYAPAHRWPMSWLYRREGARLFDFERSVALRAGHAFFVTGEERDLFLSHAPECRGRIDAMGNGVDAGYFSPDHGGTSPFASHELPVVFTGAMDYWPNVDAAIWFVRDVMPRLRERHPAARFYVVGRSPAAEVLALAGECVAVTGTVDDVRPWIAHAAAVVAPLRIARGIQNKVLEAMAMARPVVASAACAAPIGAAIGMELLSAESAADFVERIDGLIADPERARAIGAAARRRVLESYSWDVHLGQIDRHLETIAA